MRTLLGPVVHEGEQRQALGRVAVRAIGLVHRGAVVEQRPGAREIAVHDGEGKTREDVGDVLRSCLKTA